MDEGPKNISAEEKFARYILYSRWIRSDNTVKPDAFIPHPYPNLSVTRHLGLGEAEIREIGISIAQIRKLRLYGKADIKALDIVNLSLNIELDPVPNNPNHANITGWPLEKSHQKILALQLASESLFNRYF